MWLSKKKNKKNIQISFYQRKGMNEAGDSRNWPTDNVIPADEWIRAS